MIDFCGLSLSNQIVAAPSPATETVGNIQKCVKAGASAIFLKSVGPKHIVDAKRYVPRRVLFREKTLYILSSSHREIRTVDYGIRLIRRSSERVEVPLIASVCGVCNEPEEWQRNCKAMSLAGADMIQMDLLYALGSRRNIDEASFNFTVKLAEDIQTEIGKPVIVKLSPNINIGTAVKCLRERKVGVSLLDSISVGIPPNAYSDGRPLFRGVKKCGSCRATGRILYPLALLYTQKLHKASIGPICAGGGVFDGTDAAGLLLSGAKIVQVATAVCVYGPKVIRKIIFELNDILSKRGTDFEYGAKLFVGSIEQEETEVVEGTVIRSSEKRCANCTPKKCEVTLMCGSERRCEGCGLCIDICPQAIASFREVEKW